MSERKLSDGAARQALDEIHRVMTIPFDWSADTLDRIGEIMWDAGYRWVPESRVDEWVDEGYDASTLPVGLLAAWQPKDV